MGFLLNKPGPSYKEIDTEPYAQTSNEDIKSVLVTARKVALAIKPQNNKYTERGEHDSGEPANGLWE